MEPVSLSNTELFYSTYKPKDNLLSIDGEEAHHISNVMRHKIGDKIFVTDGNGILYSTEIKFITKKKVECLIITQNKSESTYKNIYFCLPRLKSADRFEFALEKSVELGITNFIVFDSKRTVAKGEKLDRWQKILLAAMKQSLRVWLPQITYIKNISEIKNYDGEKIIFDQNSKIDLQNYLIDNNLIESRKNFYFIFGPEGGFDVDEIKQIKCETTIKLNSARLRSETAIITAAALIYTLHNIKHQSK